MKKIIVAISMVSLMTAGLVGCCRLTRPHEQLDVDREFDIPQSLVWRMYQAHNAARDHILRQNDTDSGQNFDGEGMTIIASFDSFPNQREAAAMRMFGGSVYALDGGGTNERIDCHNKETGRDFSIGFQTPFFGLLVDYVTMLPDGKVIFEMDYKIVVVDPVHNRMAVLAHGRHPVVGKEETSKFPCQ